MCERSSEKTVELPKGPSTYACIDFATRSFPTRLRDISRHYSNMKISCVGGYDDGVAGYDFLWAATSTSMQATNQDEACATTKRSSRILQNQNWKIRNPKLLDLSVMSSERGAVDTFSWVLSGTGEWCANCHTGERIASFIGVITSLENFCPPLADG